MKRIRLNQLTNLIMFIYILSLYLFTFRSEWTFLSNSLAFVLSALIWLEILLLKKKIVFNHFLLFYLLFIIVCMVSVFYAINPSNSINEVRTLLLIFILMLSLINYVDTFEKLYLIMKYFVCSGFIASIYILINADFTTLSRFGSELGNVNAIGMIIATSCIFCLFFLLKTRNYWYSIIILTDLIVVLLTGSRKSLLFAVIAIVLVLIFQETRKRGSKLKALLASIVIIVTMCFLIINIPFFYDIIGKRMVNLLAFFSSSGTTEGSMNVRSNMIIWGWEWFKERPFGGYGIDNYRYLLGSSSGAGYTYSHNNTIELLVGTGIVGTVLFYITNIIVIKDLLKASKFTSKTLCFSFIAIIVGYILISVGLVYYDGKHICIILALGSIIYRLAKNENLN